MLQYYVVKRGGNPSQIYPNTKTCDKFGLTEQEVHKLSLASAQKIADRLNLEHKSNDYYVVSFFERKELIEIYESNSNSTYKRV